MAHPAHAVAPIDLHWLGLRVDRVVIGDRLDLQIDVHGGPSKLRPLTLTISGTASVLPPRGGLGVMVSAAWIPWMCREYAECLQLMRQNVGTHISRPILNLNP